MSTLYAATAPIRRTHSLTTLLIEGVTIPLLLIVAWRLGSSPLLTSALYLTAVGVVLSVIDLRTHTLPDAITLPSYIVVALMLGVSAWVAGEQRAYWRALLAGAVMFCAYFTLALIAPAGMGFGDVKLAGVLGMILGFISWQAVFFATLLTFFFGGVVGIVLMILRRATGSTPIPFGPFMLAGTLCTVLF